jgi:hypothetical protein
MGWVDRHSKRFRETVGIGIRMKLKYAEARVVLNYSDPQFRFA